MFIYRFDGMVPYWSVTVVETTWDDQQCRSILPAPWRFGNTPGCELLVRKHPLDGSLRTSIAVLDPDISILAALMMTPALPKAAAFVEENSYRIFANRSLAGAAAAYVTLCSGGSLGDPLMGQIRELEGSVYPDWLVIAAWRMIRFPETRRELREAILTAFWAGPPLFSIGVGWMLDALTMLGVEDDEAAACANVVKQVAIRLDTSQVFTTVRAKPADLDLARGR